MRITIVQGAFLPIPPVLGGAVEKIWFALGKEFAKRGHSVTHVSRRYGTSTSEEFIDGVRHVRVSGYEMPRSLFRLKWRDMLYSKQVLKVLPEADILVTNTFWLPLLAPTAKRGNVYVHVARYPMGQMKFYSKVARLQAVSTVIGNAVCKQAPRLAPRVRVIPNFVSRIRSTVRKERGKYILYVGRLHPEKGIHLLIDAFSKILSMGLTDWNLRFVGSWQVAHGGGGEHYFETLRRESSSMGNHVEWVGPVFDSDGLSAHYQESSLFVYPSIAARGEASPLAPLEAMAEGCPAVVSSLECFQDYVQPGSNGWTFDHRAGRGAANLANVLKSLISDAGELSRVREGAFRTAQEFSLPKVAGQYLSDFEEIIAQ